MKSKKLLLTVAIVATLFSCGNKDSEKKGDSETDKAKIMQDSIEKVDKALKAELELFRQDSIESSKVKEYKVKLVEGKHKYSSQKTDVKYTSLYNEIVDKKAVAAKEMWAPEKLESMINSYKEAAKGGMISIKIERLTIDTADPKVLTVIVKDAKDNEILREEMESSVANHSSSSDMWYNYTSAFIPSRIKTPFYIYIVDKFQDGPLKYEVTAVK